MTAQGTSSEKTGAEASKQDAPVSTPDFLEPLSREEEALALLQERNRFLERNKRAMINILEDIQESEEKLRAQKEELDKFKLAADNSFNHTVITDPDGHVLYANEAAEKLTGFAIGEMLGKTPALWGKQMSREFYESFWHAIKQEKRSYLGEVTNRRKDGTRYLASINASPILDARGQVKFFIGIERDITAERQHQDDIERHSQELEEANVLIRTEKERAEGILRFLESIGEAVYATDADRKIIFINKTAAEYIGKSPEEIMGTHTSDHFIFEAGDATDLARQFPIQTVLESQETVIFPNHTFAVKGGKKLPVTGTASPIIDDAQQLLGVIVIFQDITEKYELEQMKDRFLSVAAHQLRTPIGSMRWSMELLQNGDFGKLPKGASEAVQQLYDNSTRLISLVNDLLDVSRIDQGRAQEEAQDSDIAELIRKVIETLAGEAEQKGVTITYAPGEDLPLICITQQHVFDAIENLVSNAIRYNRQDGTVTIQTSVVEDAIEIHIIDTGIGVPLEDQSKLFSKFFRASNAVRSFTDGSGLGLSVVKSYVEENGGTVGFESQEGIGTTFIVRLPIHQAEHK